MKGCSVFLPITLALLLGCYRAPPAPSANSIPPANATAEANSTAVARGTVTVEIDRGGSAETIKVENVAAGTTLESVMRSIRDVPVTIHGSGTTAFLDSIGDQATSGGEGWTFQVDGEFANQGIGTTRLTPPTTVTWSYGEAKPFID